jgi:hypothetical protein
VSKPKHDVKAEHLVSAPEIIPAWMRQNVKSKRARPEGHAKPSDK